MHTLPLQLRAGHLFVEISGGLWLLDTGSPVSFGEPRDVTIGGEPFRVGTEHRGVTCVELREFIGVPFDGLLGADVLGRFDHRFDVAGGTLALSTGELGQAGHVVAMDDFSGVPIVSARIGEREYRMFLDTGAQISYLQDGALAAYPPAGSFDDFFPTVGWFRTGTHSVPFSLAGVACSDRFGTLPAVVGAALAMADTVGIVGNALFRDRVVGYFPRRRLLVL